MNKESGIKNVLYIDTSNNQRIIIGLEINSKKDEIIKEVGKRNSHLVLSLVDEILKKFNLSTKGLTAIEINLGPGSYTGLRVGVAIANSLGTVLHIPINDKNPGDFVEPIYS